MTCLHCWIAFDTISANQELSAPRRQAVRMFSSFVLCGFRHVPFLLFTVDAATAKIRKQG